MREKGLKSCLIVVPFSANLDPPAAIMLEMNVCIVVAAPPHHLPNPVFPLEFGTQRAI